MRTAIALALATFIAPPALAEVDLFNVLTPCGTDAEIRELLRSKMPDAVAIGNGTDGSGGTNVAVLLTGADYWALVATDAPGRLCVVASGRRWIVTQAGF